MQYQFSITNNSLANIRNTMSEARFRRFLGFAKNSDQYALKLYLWNSELSQSFHIPILFVEVALRNAVAKPILKRFGDNWHSDDRFRAILTETMKGNLNQTIAREEKLRQKPPTCDHVKAALPLNFWCTLLTSRYEKHFWAIGTKQSFPNLPKRIELVDIMKKAERFRRFRNKAAHHYCLIDQRPHAEYTSMMELLTFVCEDTRWLCDQVSQVNRVIGSKPQAH